MKRAFPSAPQLPVAGQRICYGTRTGVYQTDWAWALYLDKGAVGVGRERQARFKVCAVADRLELPDGPIETATIAWAAACLSHPGAYSTDDFGSGWYSTHKSLAAGVEK